MTNEPKINPRQTKQFSIPIEVTISNNRED